MIELKSRFVNITASVKVHSDGSVTAREYSWRGELTKETGYMSVEGARAVYNERHWEVKAKGGK